MYACALLAVCLCTYANRRTLSRAGLLRPDMSPGLAQTKAKGASMRPLSPIRVAPRRLLWSPLDLREKIQGFDRHGETDGECMEEASREQAKMAATLALQRRVGHLAARRVEDTTQNMTCWTCARSDPKHDATQNFDAAVSLRRSLAAYCSHNAVAHGTWYLKVLSKLLLDFCSAGPALLKCFCLGGGKFPLAWRRSAGVIFGNLFKRLL